jgi:hypothetical protein
MSIMILGQVSWLDIFVFLLFLVPQLMFHVGFFPTLFCALKALPFLRKTLAITIALQEILDLLSSQISQQIITLQIADQSV